MTGNTYHLLPPYVQTVIHHVYGEENFLSSSAAKQQQTLIDISGAWALQEHLEPAYPGYFANPNLHD